MNYYRLVDIQNKTLYDLGKASEAKFYLPFFADMYKNKEILLFGDETHGLLDDKYELKEYGGDYDEGSFENLSIDRNLLGDIEMSYNEFYYIFEKIGGEIITNLHSYIRFKYNSDSKDNDTITNDVSIQKEVTLIKEAVEYLMGADLSEENGWSKDDIEMLNKLKKKDFSIIFK